VLLGDERAAVVACCRRLRGERLVVGTAGNVSVRVGERVVLTPSGVDYDAMTAELVGVHGLDGVAIEAPLRPTSEAPMHLACYAATGARAVVHTHSVAATALSCLVDEVPPVHYYLGLFGGAVRVARYAPYGSAELAAGMVAALGTGAGCLLGNHGAVTTGATLAEAYDRAVYLEYVCEVALRVLGSPLPPRLLTPDQLAEATDRIAGYGRAAR
jgi:L-fuculose-phosphate aldolase